MASFSIAVTSKHAKQCNGTQYILQLDFIPLLDVDRSNLYDPDHIHDMEDEGILK